MTSQSSLDIVQGSDRYALMKMDTGRLAEVLSDNLGATGLDSKDLDRIRIPAGGGLSWTVPGLTGDVDEKEIIGVIVHWADRRAYWADAFSGEGKPPDCYSEDGYTGNGEPAKKVGGACAACPLSQFGSDAKGGRGQACKSIRQVFIARQGGGLLPVFVALPPTSIAPIKKYFLRLASEELSCWRVVTKLTLEKTKNASGIQYSRAVATMAGKLNPEQAQAVSAYRNAILPALAHVPIEATDYEISND